jgi:hypothetical protein
MNRQSADLQKDFHNRCITSHDISASPPALSTRRMIPIDSSWQRFLPFSAG